MPTNQKKPNKLKELLSKHSFKHKSIILELFDYSFSHKPIEADDDSFLGRNKLLNRIRSFIDDSSSTGGAYLISGFRGIGKTSLVNKALGIYNTYHKLYHFFYYWLLSLLFLFNPKNYLNNLHNNSSLIWTLVIIICGLLFILVYYHPQRRKIGKKSISRRILYLINNEKWNNLKNIYKLFFISPFKKHKYNFLNTLRTLLLSLLWLIYLYFINVKHGFDDDHSVFLTNIKAVFILFVIWIFNIRFNLTNKFILYKILFIVLLLTIPYWNLPSQIWILPKLYYIIIIIIFIILFIFIFSKNKKNILNYYLGFNKILIVKVNLGKDYLSEKDVLKYTINNFINSYKNWRNDISNPYIFIIKVFPYIILFLLFEFIATQNDISDFSSNLIKESKVYNFFPSQILLFDNHFSQNSFDKLYTKGVGTVDSYIDSLNGMYNKEAVIRSKLKSYILEDNDTLKEIFESLNNIKWYDNYEYNWEECIETIRKNGITYDPYISSIIEDTTISAFKKKEALKDKLTDYFLNSNIVFTSILDSIKTKQKKILEIDKNLKDAKKIIKLADSSKISPFVKSKIIEILNNNKSHYEKQQSINTYLEIINLKLKKQFPNIGYFQTSIPNDYFINVKDTIKDLNGTIINDKRKEDLIEIINYKNTLIQHNDKYYYRIANSLDYYLSTLYFHIRWAVFGKDSDFILSFFPRGINYLLFLSILIIWFLVSKLDILRFLGIATHRTQIRNLTLLKNKIDASLTVEKGANVPFPQRNLLKFPLFYQKNSMKFTPLDTKDIENELMRILQNIQRIPRIFTKISPLIIYDELDKIVPNIHLSIQSKDYEKAQAEGDRYKEKRQETITGILSSLKAYLSSSHAKFIFIAGRDMYDAALAGISDRQSILDSIFHDNKIYIPSFYSETSDSASNDISSMTEWFICRYLIPKEYIYSISDNSKKQDYGKYYTLKYYYKYLIDSKKGKDMEEIEGKNIIFALNNLITYITYRSNGAPKKIATLFEEFIVSNDTYSDSRDKGNIVVSSNNNSLHLELDYHAQYRLSFISYLVTPIFFKLGNYITEFSDKILVSISYLVDHIFKFHKHAFSSQNLSLTPEIIDINKEPEFRPFLREILNELSVSHLRSILSGLYEYRFQGKIRTELSFLIKLSPMESAALNFTLDESLESKRIFYDKLNKLKASYDKTKSTVGNEYIDSLALYHMTIGDLHFYDQEYYEAIINYQEAIQFINEIPLKKLDVYNTVLLIKNNLKLALAFEKDDRYKEATLKFLQISEIIIRKRDFPLKEIGLSRFVLKKPVAKRLLKNDDSSLSIILEKYYPDTTIDEKLEKLFKINKNETIVIGRLKNEYREKNESNIFVYDYEDMEELYDLSGKLLAESINKNPLNFNIQPLNVKLTSIEHIRLLYQPLVAWLYLLEKASHAGVSKAEITRALQEFSFISRTIDKSSRNILITEFYNKIGDLLYYKNRSLTVHIDVDLNLENITGIPIDAFYFYIRGLFNLLNERFIDRYLLKNELDKVFEKIFSKGAQDEDTKKASLKNTLLDLLNLSNKDFNITKINTDNSKSKKIIELFEQYFDKYNSKNIVSIWKMKDEILELIDSFNVDDIRKEHGATYLSAMANSIIDIADSYYSGLEKRDENLLKNITKSFTIAEEILNKIGEYRLAKSQLIKNLMIYVSHIDYNVDNLKEFKDFITRAVKYIYQTYKYTTVPETNKFEKIFEVDSTEKVDLIANSIEKFQDFITEAIMCIFDLDSTEIEKEKYKSYYSSLNNELRELQILYLFFELKKDSKKDNIDISRYKKIYHSLNNHPYTSHKYVRILELNLRAKVNKILYNKMINDIKYKDSVSDIWKIIGIPEGEINSDKRNLKLFLIIDSIGSISESINTHSILGVNYISTGNLTMAKVHKQMYFWTRELDGFIKEHKDLKDHIEESLKMILETERQWFLDKHYHYHRVRFFNEKADEMHSQDTEYKNFVESKYYLDDDFNDNIVHFGIAGERFEINLDNKNEYKTEFEIKGEIENDNLFDITKHIKHI